MATTMELHRLPHRYMDEVFNQRKFEVLDELFAPAVLERIKQTAIPFLNAFPDWQGTVEDVIAEGDRVMNRWTGHGTHKGDMMGIPATLKPVKLSGITIFRVADGKIVEEWTHMDTLGLMQQLGVVPSPQQAR